VTETTDDELMQRVRDGDVAPLGVLFERYQVPLYNFFLRLTGRTAVSEDLVQEVFLRVLKYRHTYRGQSQFRTWLYQIARNARADHYRKRWRETALDDEKGRAVPSNEPSVHDVLEGSQQAELIRQALQRLPDEKREVLVLSRYHDMRYEDIGHMLGCTEGTVKVRVHRAMKDLRAAYDVLLRERHASWDMPGA
jgi:RNA polymerase sigma-70 factor (ECF subfamily)